MKLLTPTQIIGLDTKEVADLTDLVTIYEYHLSNNYTKERYYEGKITLNEVNLGIALPDRLKNLEIGCAWGSKCVDVLAAKSMFDGFVGLNGEDVAELDEIALENNLLFEYGKATRDELKFGCTFATLAKGGDGKVKIKFHSPRTAAAKWDGIRNRIKCGFAIIDTVQDEKDENNWIPSLINYYTDDAIWVFTYTNGSYYAKKHPHRMGRPLMEALIWNSTSNKPFGRSRIKEPVRRLIDGYIRTVANATIGLEFATSPQKYLLGVSDDQFDAVVSDKFRQYVGSIITTTPNPETGENPQFGQLMQGSITPHVDMMRILSTQFSAATGLTVSDTGVVNDANPTSSDAIIAQSKTLIEMAEELNKGNGNALRTIAMMALAISHNTTLDGLTDEQKAIVAHFKNPAMPSIATTADAAIKIASARTGFASTDTFLEMIGFDQAEIRRIRNQEAKARGLALLGAENEYQSKPVEQVQE